MFVFLAFSACNPNYPENRQINTRRFVYVDDTFNDEEISDIQEALNSWDCTTNHIINYKFVGKINEKETGKLSWSTDLFIYKTDSLNPFIKLTDLSVAKGSWVIGYYRDFIDRVPYIYIVSDRIASYERRQLIEHELGHSFGMRHNGSRDISIMNPSINNSSYEINNYDLESFCSIYKCDPSKLKVCSD